MSVMTNHKSKVVPAEIELTLGPTISRPSFGIEHYLPSR